jgi:cell division protein ZapA
MNKVNVSIFDREYTITGEKTPEQIIKVAVHVDSKMKEIEEHAKSGPVSSLAILAAVNISDEYFDLCEELEDLKRINEQLESDSQHYIQLWDEAKKNFITHKEDSQNEINALNQQKDQLQAQLNEKDREMEEMLRSQKDLEKDVQDLSEKAVSEIEVKYKDLENNFFDLQMENIQLKSELEKLKSKLEWERNERENL